MGNLRASCSRLAVVTWLPGAMQVGVAYDGDGNRCREHRRQPSQARVIGGMAPHEGREDGTYLMYG
jgi:hypothetical protein